MEYIKFPKRAIVHMDLDSFFVSVERFKNPDLNGKPVIVGYDGQRGVVTSCSYETRKFGVHSAMPMMTAKKLCPQAIIVPGSMEDYGKHSKAVTEIIADRVPTFEKSSIDEFYIDLTGMDKYIGAHRCASELRQTIIKETGLPISFGMSVNKMVAKVATNEAKPNGEKVIRPGTELDFLAPMPIKNIPMAGKKTVEFLEGMNIKTVADLRAMNKNEINQWLGKNGLALWRKAHAVDDSPVVPYSAAKSISTETTFHEDVFDTKKLESVIIAMCEKLAQRLRGYGQMAGVVAVKIRYSDFKTVSKQASISPTSYEHAMIPVVKELFAKLYDNRQRVRLIGVRLGNLSGGDYQGDMFNDSEEMNQLYSAVDDLKNKYGSAKVIRAAGMDYHRREEYVNPFSKE